MVGGLFGGALNSILPGIGALAGPLLEKLFGGISGLFNRDQGRDKVEDFAGMFGGFDNLHQRLNELGADGERLWISLTQGVGRNNPQQAQAAIDAVTAALQRQQQKHVDVEQAAVNAAQKEVDAQAKIILEIENRKIESDRRIAALSTAIAQEAAEEEIGIIERQQREELAREQEHRAKIQAELDEANRKQEENLSRLTDAMDRLAEALKRLTQNPWEIQINGVPGNANPPEAPEGGEAPEFASGTGGRFLNFGSGTTVRLHGMERVVTEAEGRADAAQASALAGELSAIRRILQQQPEALFVAFRDALAQTRATR
jgi:hypothetical protein